MKINKFWNWVCDADDGSRTIYFDGVIASESWWNDDITPKAFREELMSGEGDVTMWLNSPGGCCVAASQIYTIAIILDEEQIDEIVGYNEIVSMDKVLSVHEQTLNIRLRKVG